MPTGRQLISLAVLLIAGAGGGGQKVAVEYEARVDYSGFLTYAWARGIHVKDARIDRAIIEGIDSRLGAAGLQRVDASGDPDLVVVYYAAEGAQLEVNRTHLAGWGPGWQSRFGREGTVTSPIWQIATGELAVEIAHVRSRRFVWRGTATSTIAYQPDKMLKLINRALDKMFQKFPPRQELCTLGPGSQGVIGSDCKYRCLMPQVKDWRPLTDCRDRCGIPTGPDFV